MRAGSFRRGILACAVVLVSLAGTACLRHETIESEMPAERVDRKLSRFAFLEDGRLAAFVVSTQATMFREKEKYIPLEFCIANRDLNELSIVRESFTLVDEEGNRYPVAQPKELLDGYPHLDQDRQRFSELYGLVSTRFSAFNQYPSKLTPTRSGRPVQDETDVPKFGVAIDFLYFPTPPTGVRGKRFELFLDTPQLEDPLFVRFTVP
jgi:hypothetical protein